MRWLARVPPVPRARLAGLRPPLADVLLAAGVLAVGQVETWMTTSFQPKLPLALLAVLITVPLAWRRRPRSARCLRWALPSGRWAPAGRT